MSKAKANSSTKEKLALYQQLVLTIAELEMKGATMPYTSHNGHMFSFLDKDGILALRLPAKEREEFISRYRTKLCEQHGTVLKEYVVVPEKLFKKTEELKEYFVVSFTYVSSLKPKAAKK